MVTIYYKQSIKLPLCYIYDILFSFKTDRASDVIILNCVSMLTGMLTSNTNVQIVCIFKQVAEYFSLHVE